MAWLSRILLRDRSWVRASVDLARAAFFVHVSKDPDCAFSLDRMEKGRRRIFDTGTKTPPPPPPTIPTGWNLTEEDRC
jgi:hypothetical protein